MHSFRIYDFHDSLCQNYEQEHQAALSYRRKPRRIANLYRSIFNKLRADETGRISLEIDSVRRL